MARKDDDFNEEELTSLEDMMDDEFSEEENHIDAADASDEFKALFDDAEEEEDYEDEDSDDDSLEILADDDSEDDDEDSLSLEELDEESLEAVDAAIDEVEAAESEEEPSVPAGSLAEAFEKMSAESKTLDFSDEDDNVLADEEEHVELAEGDESEEALQADTSLSEGTELESFESPEIEEKEFVDADTVVSVVESVLFSTDKAVSIAYIKKAFEGTTVKTDQIRKAIEELQVEYAGSKRGIFLEEISGGYQLRTKVDNMNYLKRIVKGKPFKLSGPALEVLAICAYKQPLIKAEVDEIRGVESGHLMRALMDRGLLRFAGKSELPGKPMLYETTRKFLEIFSLRSLKELPSLSEIDELIPEGIGEEEEKEHLSSVTDNMSVDADNSYSQGEEELAKIEETLSDIDTTTEFFEQEKAREKARQEKEKADGIREALEFGEEVAAKDKRWLERYDKKMEEERIAAEEAAKKAEEEAAAAAATEDATDEPTDTVDESEEVFAEAEEAVAMDETEPTEEATADESDLLLNADENVSDEAEFTEAQDESDELFANEEESPVEADSSSETEDLSTENVDNSGDESEMIFSEADNEAEEKSDAVEPEEELNAKDEALNSAFGNIQNALDAFEGEDGIDIDAEPETEEKDSAKKGPEAEA
jgi:segregation and condensation protein B